MEGGGAHHVPFSVLLEGALEDAAVGHPRPPPLQISTTCDAIVTQINNSLLFNVDFGRKIVGD